MKKLLIEFGPLLVFLATYKYSNIFIATLWMVFVTIICLALSYFIDKKLSVPLLISGTVLLVAGSVTLISGDSRFIKMKPTMVYVIFGGALYIGVLYNRPVIKEIMGSVLHLNDYHWMQLSKRFAFFFFIMAITNEIIWRNFSESFWVNFKVFGAIPMTILFVLSQSSFLAKHQQK